MDDVASILLQNNGFGADRMDQLLNSPDVSQIKVNAFDRIFYTDSRGRQQITEPVFPSSREYLAWLNSLLRLTDAGYTSVDVSNTSVIEGSFDPSISNLYGSIHIALPEITLGDPALTVRKQPIQLVTLDDMVRQGMLIPPMQQLLITAMYGRSNILISGGSGAGKTTMARALSAYIDPVQAIVTAEEIDELYLAHRLPNVVKLVTRRIKDDQGRVIRATTLEDLVKETLRMRADRIWVGETRGAEALALVKACNSGHDGSVTTVHADDSQSAWKQLTTYVVEAGLPVESAREQISRAFDLIVQISTVKGGRRAITEITELEDVVEGVELRRNPLWVYNHATEVFEMRGEPSARLKGKWGRYSVNWY